MRAFARANPLSFGMKETNRSGRSPAIVRLKPKFPALQGKLEKLAGMTREFAISAKQVTDFTTETPRFPASN
ncbi:hypothetical protein GCM10009069_22850 [Algimonas arctica]|uniref:Uncharacterized protein n=1 Tax=Algimonas arctica TaxID=1479486 RepID=A0A8J3CRL2_9PROT|nr:hypothetical protein GCM10009069_22850 [Algimonas arctica]